MNRLCQYLPGHYLPRYPTETGYYSVYNSGLMNPEEAESSFELASERANRRASERASDSRATVVHRGSHPIATLVIQFRRYARAPAIHPGKDPLTGMYPTNS